MPQASSWPYCNITTDLQRAFSDIEDFFKIDTLTDFSSVSGYSNTVKKLNTGTIGVTWENGTEMTEKTSIATVDATAGTFWYDSTNDILYVRSFGPQSTTITSTTSETITHNWGFYPNVRVLNLIGEKIDFELKHNSVNELVCTFGVAQSGTIILDTDPEDFTITSAIDDWNDLKTTMRNDAMEIVESMLDSRFPRPLPFAATSYNSENYDADIRRSTALIACSLIIKYRDPDNPLGDKLEKMVWDVENEKGILYEYYTNQRKFSFETTKDEFKGNIEILTHDDASTGLIFIAGNPTALRRRKYRIKFTTAGVPKTAKFKYSDDGGLTWSSDDAYNTYSNWFYLVQDIWIRCEGTYVVDDEWEITVADPMEEVRSRIGSIDIDTSGY